MENSDLQTGSRGFGLLAMKDITMGEFVIDYRGEVRTVPRKGFIC